MYETNAIQLDFKFGCFDIYHSGLAPSVPFFVPVYIVKISTELEYPFSTIVHIVKADKKTRARAAITQQPYVVSMYVFLACSYYTKGAISRELLASFYSCS